MDDHLLVKEVPVEKEFWQRHKVRVAACFTLGAATACIGYRRSAHFGPVPTILDGQHISFQTLAEGMPYIIVNKANQQGLLNAELSWDGGSGEHAMASVEFHDPVDWRFQRSGAGYRIINMCNQQGMLNAELSWDGHPGHAMASVEFHDPVDWAVVPSGSMYNRIVNKANSQGNYNAQLSWDGSSWQHAMASVEFHDPVDWAIIPTYTVAAQWVPKQYVHAVADNTTTVSVSWGREQERSWSQTEIFSSLIEATISSPPGEGGGVQGLTHTASQSSASAIAEAIRTNRGEVIEQHFQTGYLWQWEAIVQNNHYHFNEEMISALTRELALTQRQGQPPRCAPGYCEDDYCQQCLSGGLLYR